MLKSQKIRVSFFVQKTYSWKNRRVVNLISLFSLFRVQKPFNRYPEVFNDIILWLHTFKVNIVLWLHILKVKLMQLKSIQAKGALN